MKGTARPRTIMFLISDTGAGHRSAANAIQAAMRLVEEQPPHTPRPGAARRAATHDPNWRAIIVDGFAECANFPLRNSVFLYGPAIKHSPRLYSRIFHMTNTVNRFNTAYRISQPFLRQGITQLLQRTRPDVIVSVHPAFEPPARFVRHRPADPLLRAVARRGLGLGAWRASEADDTKPLWTFDQKLASQSDGRAQLIVA